MNLHSPIKELNIKYGVEGQIKWRLQHMTEFQYMVTRHQARQESHADKNCTRLFLDRGRHDAIAYFRYYHLPVPDDLLRLIEEAGYSQIFILDTLSSFEQRTESGRTSDRKASIRSRDLLEAVYREYGYEPVRIPELTVGERIEMILTSPDN